MYFQYHIYMKYVALLRGINVGGNAKVEMKKLKASFESLGFSNVSSYINSGNIIFETKLTDENKIVKNIEHTIKKDFGLDIRVIIRDSENIKKINKLIPKDWVRNTEMKTDVMFLWNKIDSKDILKDLNISKDLENVKYVPGAIVWNISIANYGKSKIPKIIMGKIYKLMTIRNINTVRKLNDLMSL